MPAYVILDIEVTDLATYARYKELGPPTVAAYGGGYLVPQLASGRAWWTSAEYQPAKALREAGARTEMLLVEGVPGA